MKTHLKTLLCSVTVLGTSFAAEPPMLNQVSYHPISTIEQTTSLNDIIANINTAMPKEMTEADGTRHEYDQGILSAIINNYGTYSTRLEYENGEHSCQETTFQTPIVSNFTQKLVDRTVDDFKTNTRFEYKGNVCISEIQRNLEDLDLATSVRHNDTLGYDYAIENRLDGSITKVKGNIGYKTLRNGSKLIILMNSEESIR